MGPPGHEPGGGINDHVYEFAENVIVGLVQFVARFL